MRNIKILTDIVCKKIDQNKSDELSGVRDITSSTADGSLQYYIGMTKRKFKIRNKQRVDDLKYNKYKTNIFFIFNKQFFNKQPVFILKFTTAFYVVRETFRYNAPLEFNTSGKTHRFDLCLVVSTN